MKIYINVTENDVICRRKEVKSAQELSEIFVKNRFRLVSHTTDNKGNIISFNLLNEDNSRLINSITFID